MTRLDKDLRIYKLTPADPSVWGSVETWDYSFRVKCTYHSLSREQLVKQGRDDADRVIRVFHKSKRIEQGQRCVIEGKTYSVEYNDVSGDGLLFFEGSEVENAS